MGPQIGSSKQTKSTMAKPVSPPDSLLAALPPELSQGLFAEVSKIHLAADQTLFFAGDEGDGCYRLDEGMLKASVIDPGGGERILAVLGPGSVVGELSMIDGAPRSASVMAVSESKLSFVSRSVFEAFGRSRPELYRHLTTLLAHRLRFTNDTVAATSFLSVKGRVSAFRVSINLRKHRAAVAYVGSASSSPFRAVCSACKKENSFSNTLSGSGSLNDSTASDAALIKTGSRSRLTWGSGSLHHSA
jgi:CRP-like cAMP-binding protein